MKKQKLKLTDSENLRNIAGRLFYIGIPIVFILAFLSLFKIIKSYIFAIAMLIFWLPYVILSWIDYNKD